MRIAWRGEEKEKDTKKQKHDSTPTSEREKCENHLDEELLLFG
jgi:hypothetical protein